MLPIKIVEQMIDMYTYSLLQWYYLIPNMMSRGTEVDRFVSTLCMNGIKQNARVSASSSVHRSPD